MSIYGSTHTHTVVDEQWTTDYRDVDGLNQCIVTITGNHRNVDVRDDQIFHCYSVLM